MLHAQPMRSHLHTHTKYTTGDEATAVGNRAMRVGVLGILLDFEKCYSRPGYCFFFLSSLIEYQEVGRFVYDKVLSVMPVTAHLP